MGPDSEIQIQNKEVPEGQQVLKDAEVCIACQVVRETKKGTGIKGFYCENCNKTFQQNVKMWRRFGLTVNKRKKEEHEALSK